MKISLEILMKWCTIVYIDWETESTCIRSTRNRKNKKEHYHDSITWLGKPWLFIYEITLSLFGTLSQWSLGKRRIDRRWQKNIREKYYQNQENLIDLFKKSPPIKANSKELNKAVEESNKDVFGNQYEKGRYNTEFHINTSPNLNNSRGEDFKRTKEIEDVLKKLKGRVGN